MKLVAGMQKKNLGFYSIPLLLFWSLCMQRKMKERSTLILFQYDYSDDEDRLILVLNDFLVMVRNPFIFILTDLFLFTTKRAC